MGHSRTPTQNTAGDGFPANSDQRLGVRTRSILACGSNDPGPMCCRRSVSHRAGEVGA
jgi:hypothetical protein